MSSSQPFSIVVNEGLSGTALADAAAALAPGEVAYFATPGAFWNGGLTDPLYGVQWGNRFFYDPLNRRAHLWGKNASSQGSWRQNNIYDEASNQWTSLAYQNPSGELGHIYESIAFAQEHGELYTADWNDRSIVKRWPVDQPLDYFERPAADNVETLDASVQASICWHPSLLGDGHGGLVVMTDGTSGAPRLRAWDRATGNPGTWVTIAGSEQSMSGSYQGNGAMTWVRSEDALVVAFRPDSGGHTYRVGAGASGVAASAVAIDDVPIRCGYTDGGNVGILTDDPTGNGGAYILEKGGSNRVWRLVGAAWELQSYVHQLPHGSVSTFANWFVAPLYPHGVFWAISQAGTGSQSYLWRPGA